MWIEKTAIRVLFPQKMTKYSDPETALPERGRIFTSKYPNTHPTLTSPEKK